MAAAAGGGGSDNRRGGGRGGSSRSKQLKSEILSVAVLELKISSSPSSCLLARMGAVAGTAAMGELTRLKLACGYEL